MINTLVEIQEAMISLEDAPSGLQEVFVDWSLFFYEETKRSSWFHSKIFFFCGEKARQIRGAPRICLAAVAGLSFEGCIPLAKKN